MKSQGKEEGTLLFQEGVSSGSAMGARMGLNTITQKVTS
jgi:hypothetical protein